jgi:hypothetical protein
VATGVEDDVEVTGVYGIQAEWIFQNVLQVDNARFEVGEAFGGTDAALAEAYSVKGGGDACGAGDFDFPAGFAKNSVWLEEFFCPDAGGVLCAVGECPV